MIKSQHSIMAFLLMGILVLPVFQMAAIAADAECMECHAELFERGKRSRYVHAPFLKQNCAVCHVVDYQAESSDSQFPEGFERDQLETIDWFLEAQSMITEHWILLPVNIVSGELFFKAWDGQSRTPLKALNLPSLASLPTLSPDQEAPVITNVRVADIRRGITTTATIRWETDEFSDSEILYGTDTLHPTSYDGKLNREHQMLLIGLDADKAYRFQVASRDLFGNRSKSNILTFKTDKIFIEPDRQMTAPHFAGQEIVVNTNYFRHQQGYVVIFNADRPVTLSLGVKRLPLVAKVTSTAEPLKQAAAGTGHPLLSSRLDTNITVCYTCHSDYKDAYSHPVNVFPDDGMQIPAEYQLLPDGRISCMSCHSAHGSDNEYRLIKDHKAELCRGCHTNY